MILPMDAQRATAARLHPFCSTELNHLEYAVSVDQSVRLRFQSESLFLSNAKLIQTVPEASAYTWTAWLRWYQVGY